MRWEVKVKPVFNEGDTRFVKKFAFFPKEIEKTVIWLECYYVKQIYYCSSYSDVEFWSNATEYLAEDYKKLKPTKLEIALK